MIFSDDALLGTDSGKRFLTSVVRDACDGKTVLVLVPANVDAIAARGRLAYELSEKEFHVLVVNVTGNSPPQTISEAILPFHKKTPPAGDIPSLMSVGGLPDLIFLDGFDDLAETQRKEWMLFLQRWANYCRIIADRGHKITPLILVTTVRPADPLPSEEMYLSVRCLWGVPSVLETRVICRSMTEGDSLSTSDRWREHVLPAIVGFDLRATRWLWNCVTEGTQAILSALLSYAAEQGWSREFLISIGAAEFIDSGTNKNIQHPLGRFQKLWATGAIGWTPENGAELHPSALLLLNKEKEVLHRIWRGEADLLLPFLDQIRLSICDRITKAHGAGWPTRWRNPDSEEERRAVLDSPYACQFGHLHFLVVHMDIPALSQERSLSTLITMSRWARNELAHYRPVNFRDFEGLVREAAKV